MTGQPFERRITPHGVIVPVGAAENDALAARFSEHEAAGLIAPPMPAAEYLSPQILRAI